MIEIGHVVSGKYRLTRLLGDGGMGSVYEANHEGLGTRVAIKVLHADLSRRAGLAERFLQEARVAAQIKSPHVVQVTDIDKTADGTAYIVMELLEGEPLSSILERDRKIPIPTSVEFTRQILMGLEAAHALGVIHRDLKPENVFVTFHASGALLKLIDFGIAKAKPINAGKNLTIAGVVMGTAEYMAPEQAHSADRVDARSDLYAVGVMLYEMISGIRPVMGEDARVIAGKVERGEVKPLVHAAPEVPRELAGLVHRAMAARPELRFATAAEMRLALEARERAATRAPVASVAPLVNGIPGGGATILGAPVEAVFKREALGTESPRNEPRVQAAAGLAAQPGARGVPGEAGVRGVPGDAAVRGAAGDAAVRGAAGDAGVRGAPGEPGRTNTVMRDANADVGFGAPPVAGSMGGITPSYPGPAGPSARRRRGNGALYALLALPVVVAGVIGGVVYGLRTNEPEVSDPLAVAPPPPPTVTTPATTPAHPQASPTELPTLGPVGPIVPGHVPPHPSGHPSSSASAPSASPSASGPPPLFPLPSNLAIPSFSIPSVFQLPFPPPAAPSSSAKPGI